MPSLSEARDALKRWVFHTPPHAREGTLDELLDNILASLAEEPEAETEKKIRGIIGLDYTPWITHEARETCYRRHLAEFRAPLLARLRAQEEKIRELEERGHCPDCQRSHL